MTAGVTSRLRTKHIYTPLPQTMQRIHFQDTPHMISYLQARIKHLAARSDNQHGKRITFKMFQIPHIFQVQRNTKNRPAFSFFLPEKIKKPAISRIVNQSFIGFYPLQLRSRCKLIIALPGKLINLV